MRRLLVSILVVCAAAGAARGQRALSLDDTLALARKNNRDLQAARARLEQASAGLEQARVALLPTAAGQGKYTHNYKEVTVDFSIPGMPPQTIVIQQQEQLDALATVTVPLVAPAAYPQLGAAKKTYAAGEANLKLSDTTVLFSAAQAFFVAAGADELVVARQHAVQVAKQTLDQARVRLSAGTVTRVEVTRAQLALLRAEQAQLEAVDTQATAYRSLATIIDLHEPLHVVAPAEPAGGAEASPEELLRDALRLRPEIIAFERTIEAADAQAAAARWRWAPTLSGFGNARAFNYPGFAGDRYSWAVGLQLDWAFYDGGLRDYQRHLALAQKRENEARLELLQMTVSDDIRNAMGSLATKRRALDTARRSVDLSRETLDLVRTQHGAGTATQLDLLQAQDALVSAEVSLAQAHFDLALADLLVRRTAGTFPP